jgi:hypothetical protein
MFNRSYFRRDLVFDIPWDLYLSPGRIVFQSGLDPGIPEIRLKPFPGTDPCFATPGDGRVTDACNGRECGQQADDGFSPALPVRISLSIG